MIGIGNGTCNRPVNGTVRDDDDDEVEWKEEEEEEEEDDDEDMDERFEECLTRSLDLSTFDIGSASFDSDGDGDGDGVCDGAGLGVENSAVELEVESTSDVTINKLSRGAFEDMTMLIRFVFYVYAMV